MTKEELEEQWEAVQSALLKLLLKANSIEKGTPYYNRARKVATVGNELLQKIFIENTPVEKTDIKVKKSGRPSYAFLKPDADKETYMKNMRRMILKEYQNMITRSRFFACLYSASVAHGVCAEKTTPKNFYKLIVEAMKGTALVKMENGKPCFSPGYDTILDQIHKWTRYTDPDSNDLIMIHQISMTDIADSKDRVQFSQLRTYYNKVEGIAMEYGLLPKGSPTQTLPQGEDSFIPS